MIRRIIGCADVHIKNLEGLDEISQTLDLFVEAVGKEVEEAGGPEYVRVVVAGDLFDQKIHITNEAMVVASRFLSSLGEKCRTYVIAGNHDYITSNTDRMDSITPLFEIGQPDNVVFLDSETGYQSGICLDDNVVWHLYSTFSGFSRTNAEAYREQYPDKIHVGLIHGDVNGAVSYTDYVCESGVDPSVFKGLDFVIAGHIHKHQTIKKNGVPITYCSSLSQKDFGEGITGHGYVVWDLADGNSMRFENLPIVKGYYQFDISNLDDIDNNLEVLSNL